MSCGDCARIPGCVLLLENEREYACVYKVSGADMTWRSYLRRYQFYRCIYVWASLIDNYNMIEVTVSFY